MVKRLRFPIGKLYQTPGIERAGIPLAVLVESLARHAAGDYGELDARDCAVNEDAILHRGQILSCYSYEGRRFYIITDPDRSRTTALLPNEY